MEAIKYKESFKMVKLIDRLIGIMIATLITCMPVQNSSNQLIYDSYNQVEQHSYVVVNNGPVHINQYYFHEDKKNE